MTIKMEQGEQQDEMIDEHVCLQNLQRIVSEADKEQKVDDLPLNLLQTVYQKIADEVFRVSAINGIKIKSMLWNLDNLRPEIRSKFQQELFDKWHPIYLELFDKDLSKEHIETSEAEIGVQTGASAIGVELDKADVGREMDTAKTDQADIYVSANENAAGDHRPITMGFGLSGRGYKTDWFHKLLDFVAAIVGH